MKTQDASDHWEGIYATKAADAVSWYQARPTHGLDLIMRAAPDPATPILDVGSGASTLLDALLDAGYTNVSALDISAQALAQSKIRLGARAAQVRWLVADVRRAGLPPGGVGLWHDRAVFHFLTRASDR